MLYRTLHYPYKSIPLLEMKDLIHAEIRDLFEHDYGMSYKREGTERIFYRTQKYLFAVGAKTVESDREESFSVWLDNRLHVTFKWNQKDGTYVLIRSPDDARRILNYSPRCLGGPASRSPTQPMRDFLLGMIHVFDMLTTHTFEVEDIPRTPHARTTQDERFAKFLALEMPNHLAYYVGPNQWEICSSEYALEMPHRSYKDGYIPSKEHRPYLSVSLSSQAGIEPTLVETADLDALSVNGVQRAKWDAEIEAFNRWIANNTGRHQY